VRLNLLGFENLTGLNATHLLPDSDKSKASFLMFDLCEYHQGVFSKEKFGIAPVPEIVKVKSLPVPVIFQLNWAKAQFISIHNNNNDNTINLEYFIMILIKMFLCN
jgi:hypothetical protein